MTAPPVPRVIENTRALDWNTCGQAAIASVTSRAANASPDCATAGLLS
jgi:hypothetical protein